MGAGQSVEGEVLPAPKSFPVQTFHAVQSAPRSQSGQGSSHAVPEFHITRDNVDTFALQAERLHQESMNAVNIKIKEAYVDLHEQLVDLQATQIRETDSIAKEVREKLESHANIIKDRSICESQKQAILNCLSSNGSNILKCSDSIDIFNRCALKCAAEGGK